jgi:hypothetical protein
VESPEDPEDLRELVVVAGQRPGKMSVRLHQPTKLTADLIERRIRRLRYEIELRTVLPDERRALERADLEAGPLRQKDVPGIVGGRDDASFNRSSGNRVGNVQSTAKHVARIADSITARAPLVPRAIPTAVPL